MSWPVPHPGLVIRYSYLWCDEADAGREEGVKDRPCAVVLATEDERQRTQVFVLPITHSPPTQRDDAVEIPALVKVRLGLDDARSWVVVTEVNAFIWPGPDVRLLPGRGPDSVAFGFLPPRFLRVVRERFLSAHRAQRMRIVSRTE